MNISQKVWQFLRKLFLKSRQLHCAHGHHHQCYLCRNKLRRFIPFRGGWKDVSQILLEMQVVGSDVENFACPHCHCHDRERHLFMYFDRLELWASMKHGDVLHFAPEHHISTRILTLQPKTYIKADYNPTSSDVRRIDVTCIPFNENSFDMIICNHVLEHVREDVTAMGELYRVLRPGGYAVLQTPYSRLLQRSFYDDGISTDELRKIFYGQEDHVRIYGRDFFIRLQEAGFKLQIKTHCDMLSDLDAHFYGVNPIEDLILLTK